MPFGSVYPLSAQDYSLFCLKVHMPMVKVWIVLMTVIRGFVSMQVRMSRDRWNAFIMTMLVMPVIMVMKMDMGYYLMLVGVVMNEQVGEQDAQRQ